MKSLFTLSLIIAFSMLMCTIPASAATPGQLGIDPNSKILQTAFEGEDTEISEDGSIEIEVVPSDETEESTTQE